MKKYQLLLIIGLITGTTGLQAQNNSDADLDLILVAIKKSDVDEIASHFNQMIELTVPGNEGNYSSTQAKFILKDFFKNYPPSKIEVKHKGSSKKGSKFAICHYHHSKGKFRLYYLIKEENSKFLLHILRFEHI